MASHPIDFLLIGNNYGTADALDRWPDPANDVGHAVLKVDDVIRHAERVGLLTRVNTP
ncbi:hypothetical protein [Lonsdalea britannica]|uniref:hypothetical protein n=1 Tax=Lonsdalea britannica TaxID=1082704 RepID=UPI0015935957|nr:hypothetical protein [Lonsdalea britannica]